MKIGVTLKAIRETYKQTQTEAAKGIGVSVPFLSEIEREKSKPSLKTIVKICVHFDIKVSEFFQAVEKGFGYEGSDRSILYMNENGVTTSDGTTLTQEDLERRMRNRAPF